MVVVLWRSFSLVVMTGFILLMGAGVMAAVISLNLESRYLSTGQWRNVCRNMLFSAHILRDCAQYWNHWCSILLYCLLGIMSSFLVTRILLPGSILCLLLD